MNRHLSATRRRAAATAVVAGLVTAGAAAVAPAGLADETVAVSGTVRDGSGQGWPLWADVTVDGVSATTDPTTGAFSLDLPAGSHTATVTSRYPGYPEASTQIEVGTEALAHDVALEIEPVHCFAPGYELRSTGVATNFDEGLPDGWTITDEGGDDQPWRFDNPGKKDNITGGRGSFALVDGDYYGNVTRQDTSLVTPVMDLTDAAEPVVGFRHHFLSPAGIADVDVSLDGGTTWETAWHRVDPVAGPATEIVPIPQVAGRSDVRVRFRYSESYTAANGWQLDDVFVGDDRNCDPVDGGMLTGHATDGNTGGPIPGATVTTAGGAASTTTADDGFYWMFVPGTGSHEITASRLQYQDAATTTQIVSGTTGTADLSLGAGILTTSVDAVDADAELGEAATATVTVTNDGTAPTAVTLAERPVSFVPDTEGHPRTTGSSTAPLTAAVPGAPAWQALPDYPIDIVDNVAGLHDGRIYSVGGKNGFDNAITRGFVLDPASGEGWQPLPAMPSGRGAPAAAFVDGKFYVTGGRASGIYEFGVAPGTDVYDPATDSWTTEPGAPVPVTMAGSFVLDGLFYVVGGCLSSEDEDCGLTDVFRYDPAVREWEQVADYPEPIAEPACGAIEAKAYCAGGLELRNPTKTVTYAYDPKMDTWTEVAPLPMQLSGAAHTVADGTLLVSGGVSGGRYHDATNQGFRYDPVTDMWTDLPAAVNSLARGGSTCGFYRVGGGDHGAYGRPYVGWLPGYTDCGSDRDADWMSTDVTEAALAPGESVEFTVILSGAADGPGTYAGSLLVRGDDTPYDQREVPVEFDTVAPRSWGAVRGTVTGETCDGSTTPLADMEVWVQSRDESYQLRTDANGEYVVWLHVRENPLRIVTGDGTWSPETATARVSPGRVTDQGLTLTPLSCS